MPMLTTPDGLALQLKHWPLADAARGTVLIVHGLGEHMARYAHVINHLNGCGWQVSAYDQRGHGASAGPRGGIAAADSLLADLGRVIEAVRQRFSGPLVLLGHSLGGLVAARFVAEGLVAEPAPWWQPVQALALSSPALDPGMNLAQKALLAVLGPLAPELAVNNGLDVNAISRDAAVVQAYRHDAQVHDRITPRLVRFIVDGGALVRALAPRWQVPTLLLWAGADRCVAPRGSEAFAAAAPAALLQHQRFDGLYHELFNEPEKAAVLDVLGRWLAQRTGV